MTSVALRWLSRCARYVEVSPVASTNAAIWLAKQQLNEGGWRASTSSYHTDPRAQAPLPLAAYALVALVQTKVSTFSNSIKNLQLVYLALCCLKNNQTFILQNNRNVRNVSIRNTSTPQKTLRLQIN